MMITSNQASGGGGNRNGGTSKDACAPLRKIWAHSAGHWSPSLLLIYLLPAAHTLKRWFYLHFHPPPPPPHLFFGLVSWRKKMTDDILIHISLYAILRGLCEWVFFLLRNALWFGVFFWSRGVGRKFDTRGFSWWSNELAQTQLFEPPQSERSGPVDALTPTLLL